MSDLQAEDTRGVCIYIKEKYDTVKVAIDEDKYSDGVWVSIKGAGTRNKILLGCIYRSGTKATATQHDPDLHAAIRDFSRQVGYQQKYLVGDFNLNKITWDPSPIIPENANEASPECIFVDCVRDTFLHQHVFEPTRYREGQRPTLDDLLFSTDDTSVENIVYNPGIGKSDHITIQCKLKTKIETNNFTRTVYQYDKGDYKRMAEMLTINWEEELGDLGVQEAMDKFEDRYKAAEKACIPSHTISDTSVRIKPVWMSNHALRVVKRKHSAWIRFLNTKDGEDYQRYVSKRNEASHATKRARKEFEKKLASECRKNAKGVWKYIKSNKKKAGIPDLKRKDGTFTQNAGDAAEALSQQYSSVFTEEDISNIPDIPSKPLKSPPLTSFTVTEEDVLKILKSLNPHKTPGLDGIHPKPIKELAETLVLPLTIIFKRSTTRSQLPRNWLDAVISPIYKKGQRCLPENYRPVSLLSIICKVLERIITDQIVKHIIENELSCHQQHGFTKGRSTTTNLLEALNVWSEAMMHGIPVDVLFLDYSKAFDAVPHQRLIQQVKSFGIHGEALQWISSFLSNRRQRVRVNGQLSDFKPVLSGVPQGSILGPILFTLFVNNIPDEISNIISMYADDTKVYAAVISDAESHSLADDLKAAQEWAQKMQMKFNQAKCHVMHLGRNNPCKEYTMITEDGILHTLETVESEKDLGVLIDQELKFSQHCQLKINKANSILGCLKHSFKNFNKETFLLLYKAMIRPHLEYASCVWSPHLKRDQDAIERVQRRATKVVPGISQLSYTERLKYLDLPTLKYRRERADVIEAYRILKQQHKINTNCRCKSCPNKHMLQLSENTHTRGHTLKLKVPLASGVRGRFFASRLVSDWNKLSQSTVASETVQQFKHQLHKDWARDPERPYNYRFSY